MVEAHKLSLNSDSAKEPNDSNIVPERKFELVGIQYLRALAVVLVVLDHTEGMINLPKYFGAFAFGGFFVAGAVGVYLFFAISGFIIVFVSLSWNGKNFLTKSTRSVFFWRRFVRIIPFMWLCIIAYGGLRFVGRGTADMPPYYRSMVLWPIGEVAPKQIWTLRHELLFYVIFGLTHLTATSFLPVKYFKYVVAVMAAFFISPLVILPLSRYLLPPDSLAGQWLFFLCNPANLLFGTGYLVALVYLRKRFQGSDLYFRHRQIQPFWLLLGGLVTLSVAFFIDFDLKLPSHALLIAAISSAMLILGLSIRSNTRSSLGERVGKLLGDASYSIYLTHPAFVSALLGIWSKHSVNSNLLLVLSAVSVAATIGGVAVHLSLEKPLIGFLGTIRKMPVH